MRRENIIGVTSIFFAIACGGSSDVRSPVEPVVSQREAQPAISPPGLEFFIEPNDAEVFVDGELLGSASDVAAEGVLKLPSGLHQIMIRHDVLETYRVEVSIGDTTEIIKVNLATAEN